MRWLTVKNGLVFAGLLLVGTNILGVVGSGSTFFGLIQFPVFNFNAIWVVAIGVTLIWFGVYRIAPRGKILGGSAT